MSKINRILVVDDDPNICQLLIRFLEKHDYEVTTASTAADCISILKKNSFDLILTDFRLPDMNGLDLLGQQKKMAPKTPAIIMTSYGDIRVAVTAIKMGAFEYVAKPLNPDELLLLIEAALKDKDKDITRPTASTTTFNFINGESEVSEKLQEYIALLAPTNISVIIEGESGTGKEYLARLIHNKSKRHNGPFVAIDCGALSNELAGSELFGHIKGSFTGAISDKMGQFEAAAGGTLFLDEIGNLSYDIQVKLLRALQERQIKRIGGNEDIAVDVRIIVATNEHLQEAVTKGKFREDLFHRLNEFSMDVPPLRDREDDIEIFSDYFLEMSNTELSRNIEGFEDKVLHQFREYAWPGNLRELKNIVKRGVLLAKGNQITLNELPPEIANADKILKKQESVVDEGSDLKAVAEQNERRIILTTLEKVRYNKSKAAKLLNIDRKTLYNKLRQYDIEG